MEEHNVTAKLKEETEKKLKEVLQEGLQPNNIDMVYTLMDIHKDIEYETYIQEKGELMRYRGYNEGSYNERGRGSYNEGSYNEGSYGRRRRDSRGRYAGEEKLEEMMEQYGRYSEGRGRYGHDGEKTKSFDYMLMSLEEFAEHLFEEAEDEEQIEKIKKTARRIAEM